MTKAGTYFCKKCNRSCERWAQNCPHCKAYNTVAAGKPVDGAHSYQDERPEKLSDVEEGETLERISTGTKEFDRVLGGGLVIGSAVLLAGDPGIGKSTLFTQTAIDLTTASTTDEETGEPAEPYVVLYVGAEETNAQIKLRAARLSRGARELFLYHQVNVFEIDKQIEEFDPDVIFIDSIQMMQHPEIDGPAGSLVQVKACADYLIGICKARKIALLMVAHITKDGTIAGPKTLEHLVDAVLEFHKEGQGDLRSIRASKNRFGDTNESALFRMTAEGLQSIENPSVLLLEHQLEGVTGMCVGYVADGSRPIAVVIQTLMTGVAGEDEGDWDEIAKLAEQHGLDMPKKPKRRAGKRLVTGLDPKRINQVMAVLEQRAHVCIDATETFISIAGGLSTLDPGLDLPAALAVASFVLDKALPKSFCAFGEIGLGGEIRPVEYTDARIKSAALMGFTTIAGPTRPKPPALFADGDEPDDDDEDFAGLAESQPPGSIVDPVEGEIDVEACYQGYATLGEVIDAILLNPKPKASKPPKKIRAHHVVTQQPIDSPPL